MNRSFNSTIVIGFLLVQLLWSVARAEDRNLAVVTPAGRELAARLDAMDVEHHWLPGMSIEWRSGKSLHPVTEHGVHTHCSAFVAAACERLGVAILSPPPQVHLANKQGDWLLAEGKKLGWREVTALDAQALANEGRVVVASFRNRDAKYHSGTGHIAIVRPAAKTPSDLRSDGPQIIQAGNRNLHPARSLRALAPPPVHKSVTSLGSHARALSHRFGKHLRFRDSLAGQAGLAVSTNTRLANQKMRSMLSPASLWIR